MELLRLRLKNINCFQKEVELNFEEEPLNEASLFAITGQTGSGKTTLLDALCVGLYNKTPRLDGKGNKNTYNLLNQNSNEGFSEVLFKANGKRYLAEWSVERKSNDDLSQSAKLIEVDTEKVISDRITRRKGNPSVEESVTQILNLDFDAFNRSIMLAQGEFAAFLKASPENKREILEATTGMDIYERLKATLNDKTREIKERYDTAKTILENAVQVSKEDINAIEEKISQLEKELNKLNSEREKIAEMERKENERVKVHRQLVQIQERKSELLEQKDNIDKLQSEIQAARRASDIRPQKDSFENETQNLDRAKSNVKQAENAFKNAKSEHEKVQTNFEKATKNYEDMRKASEKKLEVINAAEKQEVEAKGYFEQAEKRTDEISKLKDKTVQLKEAINSELDELSKIEVSIQKDEAFIVDNPLPDNSEKLLKDAGITVNRLEEQKKNTKVKSADLEKRTVRKNKLLVQLKDLKSEADKLKAQMQEVQKSLEDTKEELDSLLKEGSEEYWEKQKKTAQNLQECAAKYERTVSELKENLSLQENTQKSLVETEEKYQSVSSELESIKKQIETAKEKVKRYEAEEKYALISNKIAVLRKEHLSEGKPCPVCGSIEHPWSEREEPDAERLIAEAQNSLENAQNERLKLNERQSELDRKCSSLQAKEHELESGLEEYKKKAKQLESEKKEAENQWRQFYPNKDISSDYLKSQISDAEEYLKKINSTRNEYQKTKNQKQLLVQKLESNQKEIKNSQQQLNEIEKDIEKLSSDIETAKQKVKQIESEYWEMMPSEFESESPQTALDSFEKRISEVKKRNERLEVNRVKRERLKTSVEDKNNQLTNERKRLNSLKSEENEYRQKGKELLVSARKKTDGLKAEDARKKLKSELKVSETHRDEMQKRLQNKRDELKQAENNLDNAKKHYEEVVDKFNEAKNKYSEVLKSAGFDSPTKHKNALRKPQWIEENEKTVENYRKSLHSVEEQITELESNFSEEPFEPGKLNLIRKKLDIVQNKIENKVDQRGKLRRKKEELRENLKRRQNLESEFEEVKSEYNKWMKLSEFIPANKLRDFALKSMFDLLVRFANSKLDELTGRYSLKVKDMKDMVVIDKWNAGEERPVETLSGGESFLTSLSLALALSELSKGRTELNSLFLDEGFGTLDSDTLDIALATLESLRLSGRTIGVISHVSELTRRIPTRISVKKLGNGSSDLQVISY